MSFEDIKSDIQQLRVLLSVLAYRLLCFIHSEASWNPNDWLESCQICEGLKSITSSPGSPATCNIIIPVDRKLVFLSDHYCYTVFFLRIETDEEKIEPVLLINESDGKVTTASNYQGSLSGSLTRKHVYIIKKAGSDAQLYKVRGIFHDRGTYPQVLYVPRSCGDIV